MEIHTKKPGNLIFLLEEGNLAITSEFSLTDP
jgi:hypothetical protein